MKPEKDKTEKMFEALKNSPTELKLEQVEKMIMDIPNLLEAGNSPSDTKVLVKKIGPILLTLKLY